MLIIIAIFAYYNRLNGSHGYCNRLVKVLPEVNGYCNRVVIIVNFHNRFDKALTEIFQFRMALEGVTDFGITKRDDFLEPLLITFDASVVYSGSFGQYKAFGSCLKPNHYKQI